MNREILKNMLVKHEGTVLHAYQDGEGYWTIGVGRLIDKDKGGGITKEEAMFLLDNDIKNVEKDLDANIPWWRTMNETRQLVIADMCFNLGITKLLDFKNTLSAMRDGRYGDASTHMLDSKWAKQVGRRAQHLAGMMRDG